LNWINGDYLVMETTSVQVRSAAKNKECCGETTTLLVNS